MMTTTTHYLAPLSTLRSQPQTHHFLRVRTRITRTKVPSAERGILTIDDRAFHRRRRPIVRHIYDTSLICNCNYVIQNIYVPTNARTGSVTHLILLVDFYPLFVADLCIRIELMMEIVTSMPTPMPDVNGGAKKHVEEWSRLDHLTGMLETARVEADHWANSTSNSRHHYGKVSYETYLSDERALQIGTDLNNGTNIHSSASDEFAIPTRYTHAM